MARKDALLRLHTRLRDRRRELLSALSDGYDDLGTETGSGSGRDDVDFAADTINTEIISQLAEMEYREVAQIDKALARLREGKYGSCEICASRIPVARLNALPYTTLCIECQRKLEENPELREEIDGGWQRVYERETSSSEASVNLSDYEYNS
ncbi:General stress protein 16O [Planctomycetes bacterium Pan216]|uniref:General stress protein 16O n=1 Tax=Kolteria novifilia TaxID=2527975 RepID=A0A518BAU5_9BACT|nr:General stress protein 16O [Planctomycetes bacterium Pan216]